MSIIGQYISRLMNERVCCYDCLNEGVTFHAGDGNNYKVLTKATLVKNLKLLDLKTGKAAWFRGKPWIDYLLQDAYRIKDPPKHN